VSYEIVNTLFEAIAAASARRAAIQALANTNLLSLSPAERDRIRHDMAEIIDERFPQQTTKPKRRKRGRRNK
jgi:hypothetical protein